MALSKSLTMGGQYGTLNPNPYTLPGINPAARGYGDPLSKGGIVQSNLPGISGPSVSIEPVQAPKSLGDLIPNMQGQLQGQFKPVQVSNIFDIAKSQGFTGEPTKISGLGQDYFNIQRKQLKDALREEFFGGGTGGKFNEALAQESAAGRLGSGVGKAILQDIVADPYVRGLRNIDQQVDAAQLQELARVEEFNANQVAENNQFIANMAQVQAGNQDAIAETNATLQAQLGQLSVQAALAEQGELTKVQLANLEARLKEAEIKTNLFNNSLRSSIAFTEIPFSKQDLKEIDQLELAKLIPGALAGGIQF